MEYLRSFTKIEYCENALTRKYCDKRIMIDTSIPGQNNIYKAVLKKLFVCRKPTHSSDSVNSI